MITMWKEASSLIVQVKVKDRDISGEAQGKRFVNKGSVVNLTI